MASAVYDAANRLTQWGGTALAYDFNGNMTSDGANTFAWNSRDQLTAMTGASFTYDGMGRRASRTVGAATTTYLHAGFNVVQQFGAQAATLFTGLGADEVYTRTDGAGARTFLTDALGSTLGLADAAGAVQTQYTFQPYGGATVTGQASANPFQFTGRENDGTGLYYYRARYYHPGLGRFISEDPIGAGGGDQYAYAESSPAQYTDPMGEAAVIPLIVAAAKGAAIGAGIGAATDIFRQTIIDGASIQCLDWGEVGVSAGLGAVGGGLSGGIGGAIGREFSHWIPARFIRPLTLRAKLPNPQYKPWLDKYFGWFVNSRFLNGNFTSPINHYRNDNSRRIARSLAEQVTRNPPWRQQINRLAGWLAGSAAGSATGAAVNNLTEQGCSCP